VDIVKENFKGQAVVHSQIWMYFISTAIDVIKYCQKNNIDIRGLEAFRLSGHGIQPSEENNLWFGQENGNWEKAIEFISRDKNAEFLYEIWYDE
jgi:hypothetical protein